MAGTLFAFNFRHDTRFSFLAVPLFPVLGAIFPVTIGGLSCYLTAFWLDAFEIAYEESIDNPFPAFLQAPAPRPLHHPARLRRSRYAFIGIGYFVVASVPGALCWC